MTDNQEYSLGGLGARLKAAREAMHLSQKDAATRLHLNPAILQILETENFKAPPATFMRGYLRSYARLLNISEEDINTALTQSGLETKESTPVVPILYTENMQTSDRHVQRFSTVVVLGLFIFVGVWWGMHSSTNTNNTLARTVEPKTQTAMPVAPTPTTTTVQPPLAPATNVVITQAPDAPPTQPVTPPIAATTAAPPPPETTTVAPAAAPPPVVANTAPATAAPPAAPPGVATVVPLAPDADPLSVASADKSKKDNEHRTQDSTVSGFAMVLPEPGL